MPEQDITTVLAFAYRHYGDVHTSETERDAILGAICAHMPEAEAQAAAKILHHRMEARTHQLTLDGLLVANRHIA
jgi:hypothetical protein